jgi:segregation and condensation protein A
MQTRDYRVRLEAFEGPLDLLLYLIRRAEVEITDIPIASIADQYLQYIESGGVESIDIEKAGEFLVMAATLMEIKSRMLMPPQRRGDGEEEAGEAAPEAREKVDPRADLVRQLLAYKRYRDAAGRLQTRLEEWESRFPVGGLGVERLGEALEEMRTEEGAGSDMDLDDVNLVDLVEAFARIIETVDLTRVGEHHVAMDETPTELHAADIVDRLRRAMEAGGGKGLGAGAGGEVEFASIFEGRSRSEVIGLFLAMLELVKQRRIGVRQVEDEGSSGAPGRGRILLRLLDETEAAPETPGESHPAVTAG